MSSLAPRLALAGSGIALALALGWALRPEPDQLTIVDTVDTDGLRSQLAQGAALETASGLVRKPLDEEAVRALMSLRGARQYEPQGYFRYKPNQRRKMNFRDHPEGFYWRQTNSLGLRMDAELAQAAKPRIVVAGDSHIDGVGSNHETLPALLEAGLKSEYPTLQVVNTGCGAYSFYHYLGVLERLIDLGYPPHLFVVIVFGGNDFGALPSVARVFEDQPRKAWPRERTELRKQARPAAMGQGVMAVEHFRLFPEDIDLALRVAEQATLEMRSLCNEIGAELLIVYLPAPLEVPDVAPLATTQKALEILECGKEDAAILSRMGDEFLQRLKEHEVATYDLRDTFAGVEEQLYWALDLHLNLAGHAHAARALLAPVVQILDSE